MDQQQKSKDTTVLMQHPQGPVYTEGQVYSHGQVHIEKKPWSWCVVITSVFAFACCFPFGITSLVQAMAAYIDHKVGDYSRMERKKRCSYGFGIAAIVVGTIVCICYIIGAIVAAVSECKTLCTTATPVLTTSG